MEYVEEVCYNIIINNNNKYVVYELMMALTIKNTYFRMPHKSGMFDEGSYQTNLWFRWNMCKRFVINT